MSATDAATDSVSASVSVTAPAAPDVAVNVDTLSVEPISLSCPYCAAPMDPPSFRVWPFEPRLITGDCGGCGREVTLPARWLSTQPLVRQRS